VASQDVFVEKFESDYVDGERLDGEYAQDVLRIGSLAIQDQVFAQVTRVDEFFTCSSEEGIFGLGFSEISYKDDFPTLLQGLQDELRFPIFGMYLDATDDYTAEENPETDDTVYLDPETANSEIVFGGVNQKHYEGCLTWHDVIQTENDDVYNNDDDSDENDDPSSGFWDFNLDGVEVGGKALPYSNKAIIDSGSTFIVGPSEAIGVMAQVNNVACFDLSSPFGPDFVDCGSPFGFDTAAVECDDTLKDLKFLADGETYIMGTKDLVMTMETSIGPLCILRIAGDFELDGWVLGDVFFNSHYAAFDFGKKRVGFARAAKNNKEICQSDLAMDISSKGEPISAIDKSDSSNSSEQSGQRLTDAQKFFGAGFAFIAVTVLSVLLLTRRRQRYQRADRFDDMVSRNDLAVGDMELPDIT
jgi:hypothetical protein